jgi:membrane dipeptidase
LINRRDFLGRAAKLGLALKFSTFGFGAEVPKFSPDIDELYRRSLVIDALAGATDDDNGITPATLQQAIQSGVTAVNWTVSQPEFEGTVVYVAHVQSLAEKDPAHWTIVRHASDLMQAKHEGKIGIILGFQHPQPIEDLDHMKLFHQLGVRVMQLTYNNRSLLGDGCLEPGNAGLSKEGKAAVAKMNQLGIAVDLSHSGQRTTAEAIEASTKPVLITHSGCNAVFQHPRNKDDKDMKALADRGGVMGIYFMPYLVASPTSPAREHVLAHLAHALKICGEDHVGIGSDGIIDTFPDTPEQRKAFADDQARRKALGIAAPGEDRPPFSPDLNTTHRMEIIAEGLSRKGYSSAAVEKVLGKNFYRAFGEIWS